MIYTQIGQIRQILHPEIRDLPGRMNHRMPPDGTIEEKFALRHTVRFTEGGVFHRLMGAREVMGHLRDLRAGLD